VKQRVLEDSLFHLGRLNPVRCMRPIAGGVRLVIRQPAAAVRRSASRAGEALVVFTNCHQLRGRHPRVPWLAAVVSLLGAAALAVMRDGLPVSPARRSRWRSFRAGARVHTRARVPGARIPLSASDRKALAHRRDSPGVNLAPAG